MSALRQAFLNGTLERLLDPDTYLRNRIPEFVMKGDFGFASGQKPEGGFARIWFSELLPPEEISFDSDVYLVLSMVAQQLKDSKGRLAVVETPLLASPVLVEAVAEGPLFGQPSPTSGSPVSPRVRTLRIVGEIPTEVWNRLGRTLLPKLKAAGEVKLSIDARIEVEFHNRELRQEVEQILRDLNLSEKVRIQTSEDQNS